MKMNFQFFRTTFCIAWTLAVVLFGVASIRADEHATNAPATSPKYTVEEIMKAIFKGEDSTGKRISQGQGTQADYDRLVEYLSSLPLNDAPQGDPIDWKLRTTALLNSAIDLQKNKPDALAEFTKTSNCQACHRIFRPE